MVNKKAISPLIMTIILVGFTIVLSVGIFVWTNNLTKDQINVVTKWNEAEQYSFSARYVSSCGDESYINCTGNGEKCYVLLVENKEAEPVNYVVETSGNENSFEICGPFEIGAYEAKLVAVTYNDTAIGLPTSDDCSDCWLDAEILPVTV